MAHKILLLSKYSRIGASSRLRSLQYLQYLEAEGFDVTVQCLFDDHYLQTLYRQGKRLPIKVIKLCLIRLLTLARFYKYDLIWIEKEIFPYFPAIFERLLRLFGTPYVVDYDDAIFHNYDLSRFSIIRRLLGRKIDAVMLNSECVIVGNTYLEERAKSAGAAKTVLIPTVVDHSRYSRIKLPLKKFPTIGWIGSPSTQKYIVDLREPLARVCSKYSARLLLVGANPQIVSNFPEVDVEVAPWSEASEADLVSQMDIGIMPLRDSPWEKGKCGYKLIQYMASALPVVASPVGVNVKIVNDSGSGFLANSASQWEDSLSRLLQSPELRDEMGQAGLQAVQHTYTFAIQGKHLKKALLDAIDGQITERPPAKVGGINRDR